MHLLNLFLHNFFSFIFLISLLVFIHEFGHFFVARLCGVKVDVFSIGFGRELFGFTDKKSTRWKICLIPLGGYVKMFGDKNGASMPDLEEISKMSEVEKKQSFIFKNVYQRIAIVAAGPLANFILTIVIFTFLFRLNGMNSVLPVVAEVFPESAALEANLQKGDKILAINGHEIKTFDEVRERVVSSLKEDLSFQIQRGEKIFDVKITPKIQVRKDVFGDEVKMPT
jgi:regulator of sigma E protease